jgi:dipeptidase E
MRMYLSSFKIGNKPEAFFNLVGADRRVGVIMNALDNFPDPRAQWLQGTRDAFGKHGMTVTELDLRAFFGRAGDLRAAMRDIGTVWINGGNAFILRRAMKQSGFDTIVTEALARDTHVYAGFSAAAVICFRSMRGLELTDNPTDVPDGYDPVTVWEGLDLLPYAIAVHYKSDHDESGSTDREIAFYEENKIPYRALRDGEALLVNGESTTVVG